MAHGIVVGWLRPGWGLAPARPLNVLAALVRFTVLVFALHLSGAAHLLADVLLDDDLTCVDDLAQKQHHGSTGPQCPTALGIGQGQSVAPPRACMVPIAPPAEDEVSPPLGSEAAPPAVPLPSVERPPQA